VFFVEGQIIDTLVTIYNTKDKGKNRFLETSVDNYFESIPDDASLRAVSGER